MRDPSPTTILGPYALIFRQKIRMVTTPVHVAIDGTLACRVSASDPIRSGSVTLVSLVAIRVTDLVRPQKRAV